MKKHEELTQALSQCTEEELSQPIKPWRYLSQDAQRYDEYTFFSQESGSKQSDTQCSEASHHSQENKATSSALPNGLTYTQLENDVNDRRAIDNVKLREEIAAICAQNYDQDEYMLALRGVNLLLRDDKLNTDLLLLRAQINFKLNNENASTADIEYILKQDNQNKEALSLKDSIQTLKSNVQEISGKSNSNSSNYKRKFFDATATPSSRRTQKASTSSAIDACDYQDICSYLG